MCISVSGAADSTYATQRFLPVQIFDDGSKICRYLNEKFNAPADLTLASAYTLFKLRCITLSNSTGRGERRGGTKPMQKWWLKLKLPIEHEQERVYRRKAEKERQGDTKNMEQTRIRGGKIDSYCDAWNTLFSIICRPFWKMQDYTNKISISTW